MADKNTAVFGVYTSPAHAEDAATRLLAAGFSQTIFRCCCLITTAPGNLLTK